MGSSHEARPRKRAKTNTSALSSSEAGPPSQPQDLRVEPVLGIIPLFTSRKPAVKLADTRTGFKKKLSLRQNCVIAETNVESGRWTASDLHNSVNALYASFRTGTGATATWPFDAVQTDAVSSLKAWIELEWPGAFSKHEVYEGPPPGPPPPLAVAST